MKQSLNKDTLAYQIGMRPALQHRDMSALPLTPAVDAITNLLGRSNIYSVVEASPVDSESVVGSPERDALIFYLMNHAVTLVRQRHHVYEPLGKYLPIVEAYHLELAARASRMFAYLLLICTRESRHDRTDVKSSPYGWLSSKYGKEVTGFHTSLKGKSSLQAAGIFQANPPPVTLGAYTNFLSEIFHQGKYHHGYGGKAWGAVADVLRDFVHGKITSEMMMDTAFTLCHNNGPIFNKGMLFNSYSSEIYLILDVQRSGQIPQLVATKQSSSTNDSKVASLWSWCHDLLGEEFNGYVDWFLVEELGAMKSYASQKSQQLAMHPYPTKLKAKQAAEKAKAEVLAAGLMNKVKQSVEIFPGQYITKVERTTT